MHIIGAGLVSHPAIAMEETRYRPEDRMIKIRTDNDIGHDSLYSSAALSCEWIRLSRRKIETAGSLSAKALRGAFGKLIGPQRIR